MLISILKTQQTPPDQNVLVCHATFSYNILMGRCFRQFCCQTLERPHQQDLSVCYLAAFKEGVSVTLVRVTPSWNVVPDIGTVKGSQ